MLEPWIIEQIRRREEEERRRHEQPRLEIPSDHGRWKPEDHPAEDEEPEDSDRGVVVIDI